MNRKHLFIGDAVEASEVAALVSGTDYIRTRGRESDSGNSSSSSSSSRSSDSESETSHFQNGLEDSERKISAVHVELTNFSDNNSKKRDTIQVENQNRFSNSIFIGIAVAILLCSGFFAGLLYKKYGGQTEVNSNEMDDIYTNSKGDAALRKALDKARKDRISAKIKLDKEVAYGAKCRSDLDATKKMWNDSQSSLQILQDKLQNFREDVTKYKKTIDRYKAEGALNYVELKKRTDELTENEKTLEKLQRENAKLQRQKEKGDQLLTSLRQNLMLRCTLS
eukprot:g1911.t1